MTRVPEDPERSAAHATFALVIPTHRRPDLVVQAVESALRQTRPFDQVVVVADGLDDPAVIALETSQVEVVEGADRRLVVRSGAAFCRKVDPVISATLMDELDQRITIGA